MLKIIWICDEKYHNCCESFIVILAYDIGEQEIPAGDKSQQLSDGHIAVKVCRPRLGNAGPELGVAQSGEDGCHGGDEEGDDDAGPGAVSGHLSGQDVHPGSQSAAHAQGHQVHGGQASVEGGLLPIGIQRLPPGDAHQEGLHQRHALWTRDGQMCDGGTGGRGSLPWMRRRRRMSGRWRRVDRKSGRSWGGRRGQRSCE